MPRHRTSPIVNSWPTSAFRSMPRVTTFRRCSLGVSGGSNDSHTSDSIIVSALPGLPDGKVPVPATCRSPSSPSPAIARAVCNTSAGSAAAPATASASTVPTSDGAAGRGGSASAMSAAASRNPSSIASGSTAGPPAGSQTTPDGTPYITTKRPPARAIHGPGHENVRAPAIGARPSPRPPSHRDTVHPVAGSSSPAGTRQILKAQLEDRGHAGQERNRLERELRFRQSNLAHHARFSRVLRRAAGGERRRRGAARSVRRRR